MLRSAGIALAGLSELHDAYQIGRLDYPDHVVIWTLSGCGRFSVDGETVDAKRGDRMVIPARYPYGCVRRGRSWHIAWIHLRATEEWRHLSQAGWQIQRGTDTAAAIADAMAGYLRESHRASDGPAAVARIYAELAVELLRRDLAPGLRPADIATRDRLQRAWDYIEQDLSYPWTVAELATHAHLSSVQFHRHCTRHLGQSPMAYLTGLRMQRAEALLRTTTWPLKQIAPMVGYANEFAFSTAFKRARGCSPAAWRDRR